MHLALAISVVLLAMLFIFRGHRYPIIRKKLSSIIAALLAVVLLVAASISAFYITLKLPIVGAIAFLGAMLISTKIGQRAISNKDSIWSRGAKAVYFVTKIVFIVVVSIFVLARIAVAVAQFVKGE